VNLYSSLFPVALALTDINMLSYQLDYYIRFY